MSAEQDDEEAWQAERDRNREILRATIDTTFSFRASDGYYVIVE